MPIIVDTEELAQQQITDKELQRILQSFSYNLELQKFLLLKTNSTLYCDCSQNNVRPFIPMTLCRHVFDMVYGVSRVEESLDNKSQKFVWTNINKDITAKRVFIVNDQRRQNCLTPEKLPIPNAHFDYIHFDIIRPFLPSRGFRYCLTLIDCF